MLKRYKPYENKVFALVIEIAVTIFVIAIPFAIARNAYHRVVAAAMFSPAAVLYWSMRAGIIDCKEM